MDIHVYLEKLTDWAITSGVQILIILIVAFIALKIVNIFSKHLVSLIVTKKGDEELFKRTNTFSTIVRYILHIAILFVAIILILEKFGVEFGPILAAAGIAGLAIGFGAQSLVKDIISGLFILLEDQIRVGDVVQISGKGGVVEAVAKDHFALGEVWENDLGDILGACGQVKEQFRADIKIFIFRIENDASYLLGDFCPARFPGQDNLLPLFCKKIGK